MLRLAYLTQGETGIGANRQMLGMRGVWAWIAWAAVLGALLTGCANEKDVGVVSGTVTDIENEPVANAEVFVEGTTSLTRTLHNGTFYLTNVPEGFTIIRARAVIRGVEYTGQNVAQVFPKQQSKSVNIMIAPADRQGTIEGFVRDAFGAGIQGARVFAGGPLSSAFAVTDRRGFYRIRGLPAGYEYPVVASAPGYENVKQLARVYANETTVVGFTLNRSVNRPVDAPQNLEATAWTLPQTLVATRSVREREAYNAIRALFDNKPRKRHAMATRAAGDYWIEVELSWDYREQVSLLGYGIYRGRTVDELRRNAIAYLRDPLADFFADLDPALQPNVNYFYEITALNTDYPDQRNSESARSNRVSARPFAPIAITSPRPNEVVNNLIVQWTPVPNADYYLVLIYDRFPDYQVQPYFPVSLSNPGLAKVFAPGTSLVYPGTPALVRGRTYYLVVLAFTNDRSTRAISQIVPFQVR